MHLFKNGLIVFLTFPPGTSASGVILHKGLGSKLVCNILHYKFP